MLLVQAALFLLLVWAVSDPRVPLGVRGEWEWGRMPFPTFWADVCLALAGLAFYALFVARRARALELKGGVKGEAGWLAGLFVAAVGIQAILPFGAPLGFGLAKWSMALYNDSASGYYTVAKTEIADASEFLTHYTAWQRSQRVPRLGAHPPGLFLVTHAALTAMHRDPALARAVMDALPESVRNGFKELDLLRQVPRPDRAGLALLGVLTLLCCSATVVPLYLLARSALSPQAAWAAAALWPLVPSAILFQPTADTAYPFFATSALALAAWSGRGGGRWGLACAAGVILGLGVMFSLVFFAVGLTVGLVLASLPGQSAGRRARLILATGAGFLAVVLAIWALWHVNPFLIWLWNRRHHASFYAAFPRSYTKWVIVNWLELGIGFGIPAAAWAARGYWSRATPRFAWAALGVLAILSFGGQTLSEVSRLWLPWMPTLLVASASGMAKDELRTATVAATVVLLGIETVLLQSTLQLVYPM
jgi:methylthioxylose transferase